MNNTRYPGTSAEIETRLQSQAPTIHLIQHSHTDIGYTSDQHTIVRAHSDFIRDVLRILDQEGPEKAEGGFRWQLENFWQLEQFLSGATPDELASLVRYIDAEQIGVSLNYLNSNELIDGATLRKKIDSAVAWSRQHGGSHDSAMTADVNGYAWGYAQTLFDAGVRNFASCVHTVHGYFPAGTDQQAFWWETPKGDRLLVWVAPHYQIGNDLGMCPDGVMSYTIRDEWVGRETEDPDALRVSRISRYLDDLRERGFAHTAVPAMISGAATDNAPPNALIAETVRRWNAEHGDIAKIELSTLDRFFARLRSEDLTQLPIYAGDWTDWWADGVGSTPREVKLVRQAQRRLRLVEGVDRFPDTGTKALIDDARDNIALYAEHTWGHSHSVELPWNATAAALDLTKGAYAVQARVSASRALENVLAASGEITPRTAMEPRYRVLNPHDREISANTVVTVEHWQVPEGRGKLSLKDAGTGRILPTQSRIAPRGTELLAAITLGPRESADFELCLVPLGPEDSRNRLQAGTDRVIDIDGPNSTDVVPSLSRIETPFVIATFDSARGLVSLITRPEGQELVRADAENAPFAGIWHVTPGTDDQVPRRGKFGRNRRMPATQRHNARLSGARLLDDGEVSTRLELDYSLAGTEFYTVTLELFKTDPRIRASVRVHKQSVWDPESLSIALPFSAGPGSVLTVEKTASFVRPGIDQIPGTLQDFYLAQRGIAWNTDGFAVGIALPDAPLITLGTLEHAPIKLNDGDDFEANARVVYSLVANNFWETNFRADIGGFHEFDYVLTWGSGSAQQTIEHSGDLVDGLLSFPIEG